MKEVTIKGTLEKKKEDWYLKNNEQYFFASDLILGIDSVLMQSGNTMTSEGEEIEIIVRIKER